jgi:hypothetical protein
MIGSAQGVFVGRQREMGELKAALEEAEAAAKTALASPPVAQAIESRARAGTGRGTAPHCCWHEQPGIPEELIISPNTVLHHVSSILSKTGVANRAEAPTHAARNGLVSW